MSRASSNPMLIGPARKFVQLQLPPPQQRAPPMPTPSMTISTQVLPPSQMIVSPGDEHRQSKSPRAAVADRAARVRHSRDPYRDLERNLGIHGIVRTMFFLLIVVRRQSGATGSAGGIDADSSGRTVIVFAGLNAQDLPTEDQGPGKKLDWKESARCGCGPANDGGFEPASPSSGSSPAGCSACRAILWAETKARSKARLLSPGPG